MEDDVEIKINRFQKFLETKLSLEVADSSLPYFARNELLNMTRIQTWRPKALLNTTKICSVLFIFLVLISILAFNWILLTAGTVAIFALGIVIFRSWAATCTRCKREMKSKLTKRDRINYDFCDKCYTYSKVTRYWGKEGIDLEYDERLPPS